MQKRLAIYLGCLLMVFFETFSFGSQAYSAMESNARGRSSAEPGFTEAEKNWLSEHKTIRVAFDGYFPPYSMLTDNGGIEGLAVDVMRVLADRIGVTLVISSKTVWKDLFQAAQHREVDVVATMGHQPEREQWFAFTRPYIFKSLVIMTREETTDIGGPVDLSGKRVALVEDYQYVKPLLDQYPDIQPYYVETMLDGLNAVAVGKADAAISFFGIAGYLKVKYQIAGLKFAAVFDRDHYRESIGVRGDWPELAGILDKALGAIDPEEMAAMQKKWLAATALSPRISLTSEERTWLRDHPVIRVGIDPEFPPFEFTDKNGHYAGIASEYLNILEARLGVTFEVALELSRSRVMEKARNREIDLLPCVGRTAEGEQYLHYSDPYLTSRRVIVTRADASFISGLDDIRNWKAAVQADSSGEEYLKTHSTIDPLRVATVSEGLVALSGGQVDAFVNNIGSTAYWIRKLNITNLKIAAPVSEEPLHMAVRKDWPVLIHMLNKGLAAVSETERDQISKRWISVEYKSGIFPETVYKYLAVALGLMLLTGTGFIAWNRSLKKQVNRKTADLRRELEKRQAAEAAAAASQKLLQDFSDNSASLFYAFDPDGRFLMVNRRFADLFGVAGDSLIGKPREVIMPPEIARSHRDNDLRVIAGGKPIVVEEENEESDGTHTYLSVKFPLIDPAGDLRGVGGISADITDRKRIERELNKHREHLEELVARRTAKLNEKTEELEKSQKALQYLLEDVNAVNRELKQANEKLKELDRLKSMFIASMSHELRTPLNSIIGFTGIILQGMSGEINAEITDQLQRVYRSGKHLLALINDVIDISKIEAGRIDVYPEDVDIAEVVREVVSILDKDIKDKGLALEVTAFDHLMIRTDRKRLYQCVLNIGSNAVKYTEKGKIRIAAAKTGDNIEITVTDTGIGISEKDMKTLFEPFVRIDSPLRTKVPGTGLGLYLTKKIVTEILGGEILAESRCGEGSCFGIRLPLTMAERTTKGDEPFQATG